MGDRIIYDLCSPSPPRTLSTLPTATTDTSCAKPTASPALPPKDASQSATATPATAKKLFTRLEAGEASHIAFNVSHCDQGTRRYLEEKIVEHGGELVPFSAAEYIILPLAKGDFAETEDERAILRNVGRVRGQKAVSHQWVSDNFSRRNQDQLIPISDYIIREAGDARSAMVTSESIHPLPRTPPRDTASSLREVSRNKRTFNVVTGEEPAPVTPKQEPEDGRPAKKPQTEIRTPLTRSALADSRMRKVPSARPTMARQAKSRQPRKSDGTTTFDANFKMHDDPAINRALQSRIQRKDWGSVKNLIECLRNDPRTQALRPYLAACEQKREGLPSHAVKSVRVRPKSVLVAYKAYWYVDETPNPDFQWAHQEDLAEPLSPQHPQQTDSDRAAQGAASIQWDSSSRQLTVALPYNVNPEDGVVRLHADPQIDQEVKSRLFEKDWKGFGLMIVALREMEVGTNVREALKIAQEQFCEEREWSNRQHQPRRFETMFYVDRDILREFYPELPAPAAQKVLRAPSTSEESDTSELSDVDENGGGEEESDEDHREVNIEQLNSRAQSLQGSDEEYEGSDDERLVDQARRRQRTDGDPTLLPFEERTKLCTQNIRPSIYRPQVEFLIKELKRWDGQGKARAWLKKCQEGDEYKERAENGEQRSLTELRKEFRFELNFWFPEFNKGTRGGRSYLDN